MADPSEKLLIEGVRELYYTEQQLIEALETLAEQTDDDEASRAFEEHREETETHVDRLERVFDEIDEQPRAKEDVVVSALIAEHEQFARENDGETLDRYNMSVGQKTEHYEIAAYGNVTSLAGKHGYDDAADLLAETLEEEEQALEEVAQASERFDEHQIGD